MRTIAIALFLAWLGPFGLASVVAAGEASTDDDPLACAQLQLPDAQRVWSVSFVMRARDGGERRLRANIFSRREDGAATLVTRITHPEDLAGSRLFMLQRADGTEIFLQTADMERPKRVTGERTAVSVFGTDFSYEDFERIYGLNRPGEVRRLEDSSLEGRPVRVLEIKPAGGSEASAYSDIRAYVDEETCVPLRMEFHDAGSRLRKLLTVDPQELRRDGAVYMAHSMRMQDLVEGTETRLIVLGQGPVTRFPEVP